MATTRTIDVILKVQRYDIQALDLGTIPQCIACGEDLYLIAYRLIGIHKQTNHVLIRCNKYMCHNCVDCLDMDII